MDNDDKKDAVRVWFHEIFAKRDFTRIEEVVSEDYTDGPGHQGKTGPDFVKEKYSKLDHVFSDIDVDLKQLVAEKNKVVAHYVMTATHIGPYLGIEATNKRFTQEGMTILEFEDDKVVYTFGVYDRQKIIKQLTE